MLNTIQDFTVSLWKTGRKVKQSPSGWQSGNAPCCVHNGETADTRGRGGIHTDAKGNVSYSCFNCKFKASYQPGRHLSFKYRKLLQWLGASENDIKRLVIEAIRIKDLIAPEELAPEKEEIKFEPRTLPTDAISFKDLNSVVGSLDQLPKQISNTIQYVADRAIDLNKYDFYISEQVEHSLHQRVIIPCIWRSAIIGYTSRAVTDGVKPKYYSHYEPNFVFNTNNQLPDAKFVIVCEGPFDAMSVDGVAVLGNEVSEQQADIIDSLGREVIVVPDFDYKNGKWTGQKLVDAAQEYGWSVSFPVWRETCKDINEAVVKYGKLFVLKSILAAKETSKLKIELRKKRLHN